MTSLSLLSAYIGAATASLTPLQLNIIKNFNNKWLRLYYRCDCGEEWEDEWDCACNDLCPSCNKEIEPYYCDEVE